MSPQSSSLSVVKSIPNMEFNQREGLAKPAPLPVTGGGAVSVIDLGTPRLGTAWDIGFINVRFALLEYGWPGAAFSLANSTFNVTSILSIGSAPQFTETSNVVSVERIAFNHLQKSILVALQNLPQIVRVPGGQQVLLEMRLEGREPAEGPNGEAAGASGGYIALLKEGKLTMGYELLRNQSKPQRAVN